MDAADWDARYADSELVWSRGPNRFVEAECTDLPAGRAVDLACGEGRNAIWLARRGWDVTAVDFSQVALDKGRQLAVVAYFQVPADERRATVRHLVASLRPGGTLVWVAHDSTNLTEGSGGPQDPRVLMTADDLLADLDGIPVDVARAERVPRVVAAADEHGAEAERTAWDCLVRLRRAAV